MTKTMHSPKAKSPPAQPTPRQAGAIAALAGRPLSDNPYAAESLISLDAFYADAEWRSGHWAMRSQLPTYSQPSDGPIEMVTVSDGDGHPVEVARYSDDHGTPEMRRQQQVYDTTIWEKGTRLVDGKEKTVKEMRKVHRVRDLLGDLHRRDLITKEQMDAGRHFRRDFEIGQLDPRRACDIRRPPGGSGRGQSDYVLDAQDAVGRAMQALGGHGCVNGQCAWWCLGVALTPKEWGIKKIFGGGRAISEGTARGIVLATVAILEVHYARERQAGIL
jgi:Domain of unknown function (DUF6456)